MDFRRIPRLNVITKLKVETFNQRKKHIDLRGVSSFVGLINKADYTLDLGRVQVQPRFKSEFRRERPRRRGGGESWAGRRRR